MKKAFVLKSEIIGGGPNDVRRTRTLNGQISWNDGEILWEADPRHVEILAEQLGFAEARLVMTPGEKTDGDKSVKY